MCLHRRQKCRYILNCFIETCIIPCFFSVFINWISILDCVILLIRPLFTNCLNLQNTLVSCCFPSVMSIFVPRKRENLIIGCTRSLEIVLNFDSCNRLKSSKSAQLHLYAVHRRRIRACITDGKSKSTMVRKFVQCLPRCYLSDAMSGVSSAETLTCANFPFSRFFGIDWEYNNLQDFQNK